MSQKTRRSKWALVGYSVFRALAAGYASRWGHQFDRGYDDDRSALRRGGPYHSPELSRYLDYGGLTPPDQFVFAEEREPTETRYPLQSPIARRFTQPNQDVQLSRANDTVSLRE